LQELIEEGTPLTWSQIRRRYLDMARAYRILRRVDARRLSAGRVGQEWRRVDHARLMNLIGYKI